MSKVFQSEKEKADAIEAAKETFNYLQYQMFQAHTPYEREIVHGRMQECLVKWREFEQRPVSMPADKRVG